MRPRSPVQTVPGCLLHGCGVFLLPVLVTLPMAQILDIGEVADTGTLLGAFTALVVLPVSLALTFGVLLKSASDIEALRRLGALSPAAVLDVLYRHVAVLTPRGWLLFVSGTVLVAIALSAGFAEFGVLAVLLLLTVWFSLGATALSSTLLVRWFRARGAIERSFEPAVVVAGDDVRDVVTFRDVPVPWGYALLFEDDLPPRMATRTRWALATTARAGEVRCDGSLRVVPRGVWRAGPARICYQDLLGLTQISVASLGTADLKVLPRVVPVTVIDPPRVMRKRSDVVSRLHRLPTDDPFRLREYAPGDDVRRIHWKRSLREGRLHVRIPETREREVRDVLLAIDTHMPAARLAAADSAADVLDGVVSAFVGLAHALVAEGHRVTVAASAEGRVVVMPVVRAHVGSVQDLGARLCWQGTHDVAELLAAAGDATEGVVVTARWTMLPPRPLSRGRVTWAFLDPVAALGSPEPAPWAATLASPRASLRWLLLRPTPAGSEDDARWRRWRDGWQRTAAWRARNSLRTLAAERHQAALTELRARGEAIFRIELRPRGLVLVGDRVQLPMP